MSWEIKKIKDVALIIAGQSPEGKFYNEIQNGLPFYQGKKEFSDRFIGEPKVWTSLTTKEAIKDDLLMSVRAPVGPVNFATQNCCIGRGLAAIRVQEKFDKDFLFHFFKHIENTLTGNTGAVFNSINKTQIENIEIPVPSLEEQRQVIQKLDAAFELIDQAKANIEKNIQNAKDLFQSKLNQVFSQKGDGWEEKTLSELILKTKNINPKDFENREYKYVDVSAVDRKTLQIKEFSCINSENAPSRARKSLLEKDIIFATVRPTLKRVCLITKEFDKEICSTGYVVLRPNRNLIDPKMIFYFLQTSMFMKNMEELQKGASYPAVTDGEVKDQKIVIPINLDFQERIILNLDLLANQTEVLQQKYQQKLVNLEELRKSILEKAFKGEFV
ncbi:restriction endonuclease subunit S [Chryseobacterium piscium]|uniref:Restriction endonuclease subunit S n=1 Tax=Chryseobacterium piscium TaxID=333702 RepID=A0A3D9BRX5_9FLAO|nr:restriction endonuclease subunit S [Chryseobacterium piscium]REC56265.1 restriction endonuclease subunit S [Chryseobacterium piscium]